jgi:ABC-type amino acid transport substrate-binding protein
LSKQGIAVVPFKNFEEGLLAVADKKIDAFVQDEYILKYQKGISRQSAGPAGNLRRIFREHCFTRGKPAPKTNKQGIA